MLKVGGTLEGAVESEQSWTVPKEAPASGRLRGKTRNHQELTCELGKAELAQSVAGVGVVVQHDEDGKLPVVHLGAPHHAEVGQGQRGELIHGHEHIAGHFSNPL